MPLLYYSNIAFFDNNSQTLPEGMDLSTNVLIDCQKFDFKQVSKTKFRTNNYFNEKDNLICPKSKDILVFEYDVELKKKEEKVNNENKNEDAENKKEEETKIDNNEESKIEEKNQEHTETKDKHKKKAKEKNLKQED